MRPRPGAGPSYDHEPGNRQRPEGQRDLGTLSRESARRVGFRPPPLRRLVALTEAKVKEYGATSRSCRASIRFRRAQPIRGELDATFIVNKESLATGTAEPPPAISVILVATEDYALIRPAVRNLTAQRDAAIELVIPGPQAVERSIRPEDRADLATFAYWRHVVVPEGTRFDEARAAGVRAASAPIVAFAEDHSFPQPGWAAALVDAFQDGGVSVVGPVVENGNPGSTVSWANFLLEYGEWMPPGRPDGRTHLPGHNSAYRRELLLALGSRLTSMIESESVLHWQLARDGHRLKQEPRARTRHMNFSRLRPSLALRYHLGRQFAANRAEQWPGPKRAAYAAAFPLIAAVRVARVARTGVGSRALPAVIRALPLVAVMVTVASIGEAVGNITRRAGSSAVFLNDIEHDRRRFMRNSERELWPVTSS